MPITIGATSSIKKYFVFTSNSFTNNLTGAQRGPRAPVDLPYEQDVQLGEPLVPPLLQEHEHVWLEPQ